MYGLSCSLGTLVYTDALSVMPCWERQDSCETARHIVFRSAGRLGTTMRQLPSSASSYDRQLAFIQTGTWPFFLHVSMFGFCCRAAGHDDKAGAVFSVQLRPATSGGAVGSVGRHRRRAAGPGREAEMMEQNESYGFTGGGKADRGLKTPGRQQQCSGTCRQTLPVCRGIRPRSNDDMLGWRQWNHSPK